MVGTKEETQKGDNKNMVNFLDTENNNGFRIDVCKNVLPTNIREDIDVIKKFLEECKKADIKNNDDYINVADKIKTVKSVRNRLIGHENTCLKPVNDLAIKLVGEFDPLRNGCDEVEHYLKNISVSFDTETENRRRVEKIEAEKRRKEKQDKQDKEIEAEKLKKEKEAEELRKQKEAEIKKKEELERKIVEKEKEVICVAKKIECVKKEIVSKPDDAKKLEDEVKALSEKKDAVTETIEKINKCVDDKCEAINIIAAEEMATKKKVSALIIEKNSKKVPLEKLATAKIPKIDGTNIARYVKYKCVNLAIVPKEYVIMTIVLDEKKVRETVKLEGMNTKIPGIEVYEEKIMRSTEN